ncbi:MAG: hypothetical protein AAF125_09975, partial [Chloroflexota bacterium]
SLDGGTGRTEVTLPGGVTNAQIDGGVGILRLNVPNGARSTLNMKLSAGPTALHIGAAQVRATIEGGVGNCEVFVPSGAPLRVRAESGLGNIEVPPSAQPMRFETEFISESGIWETLGYGFAPQKIDLRFEGGVGSLLVRERPSTADDQPGT